MVSSKYSKGVYRKDKILDQITKCMAVTKTYPDVEKVQTNHRIKLFFRL